MCVKVGDVVTIDEVPVGAIYSLIGQDESEHPARRRRVAGGGLCMVTGKPESEWYLLDDDAQKASYQILSLPESVTEPHKKSAIAEHTPAYYRIRIPVLDAEIQVMDVIEGLGLGFNLGCAIKYIARAGKKGPALEDLKKARNCIDREIQHLEAGEPAP